MVSAYVASVIPWAMGQPAENERSGAFIALSAIIAGFNSFDPDLAARLHEALLALDPSFDEKVRSLLALIEQHKVDPVRLQATLDAEGSSLAPFPRVIASAWFLGIVGSGDTARCIAYEDALNAVIVSDVLKPPTYCYGPYGSWARKPV